MKETNNDEGFLLPFFEITLNSLIYLLVPNYFCEDILKKDRVFLNFILLDFFALIMIFLSKYEILILVIFKFYAFYRILCISLQLVHALFVGYTKNKSFNKRAPLAVGIHFIETIFLFSVLYTNASSLFEFLGKYFPFCSKLSCCCNFNEKIPDLITGIYVSITTATTLGYGEFHPTGSFARVLISFQSLLTVLVVTNLIGKFISSNDDEIKIIKLENKNSENLFISFKQTSDDAQIEIKISNKN